MNKINRTANGYNTVSFLEEMKLSAQNRIGNHVARKHAICAILAKDSPELAALIADEIEGNPRAASEVSGMHPDSCRALAFFLKNPNRIP
jgi:hypothetical protein